MKAKGALAIGILGAASLGIAGCAPITTDAEYQQQFTSVTFEEMIDSDYMVGQFIKYEGGFCYDGGLTTPADGQQIGILFEDETSGEAFLAHSTSVAWSEQAKVSAALSAVNCDEEFIAYGKKIISEQGNPELELSDLEFKLGPYRTETIHLQTRMADRQN